MCSDDDEGRPDRLEDRLATGEPDPEERLLAAERVTLLRQAIQDLAPDEADIIRRHYGMGTHDPWTIPQLAIHYRATEAQIAYRLRLARAQLKKRLA